MSETLNIPFMPKKGEPPFHLRPLTPEEVEQCRRMLHTAELRRRMAAADSGTGSNE